ncbi:MAG: efflux RND transporter periplasmic adaptor subunit [Acidobacteria bacterium]|nr:MAG: efflux RND transporter periplasmic adaptor subunit [Acidobacteriota bacterium]
MQDIQSLMDSRGNYQGNIRVDSARCIVLFPVFVTLGLLLGCTANTAAPPPPSGVPVVVARVSQKLMPVEVASVGNVEPISTVAIKAQISGELLEVHFKEGDFVRKGQLLFTIDSRIPQGQVGTMQANIEKDEAQLKQAEANLARDTAQLVYARAEAERYATLLKRGLVAADSSEQARSQANALEESVRADRAAIENVRAILVVDQHALGGAKLQLSYCTIYSPIDGRTGAVMVKPGNLVKPVDVPIVVINQTSPIYVNFTVPQQYWPDIKKNMNEGMLHVSAAVPQDSGHPKQGNVIFVDNAVDATTGTLHLKATFENSENHFLPGMFVSVLLRLSEQPNAKVVPTQAVTEGQNGTFVYVVKPDDTVEMRPVVSGHTYGGEAVIDSGLESNEVVVTDGQTRLVPGAKVQVTNNLSDVSHP